MITEEKLKEEVEKRDRIWCIAILNTLSVDLCSKVFEKFIELREQKIKELE